RASNLANLRQAAAPRRERAADVLLAATSLRRDRQISAAAIKADAFERLVDFLQRLLTEVGNAQEIIARAIEQVANREDAFLLEAVGGSHRQADLGRAEVQAIGQRLSPPFGGVERDTRPSHSFPPCGVFILSHSGHPRESVSPEEGSIATWRNAPNAFT